MAVLGWHVTRLYMEENVDHLFVGLRWEREILGLELVQQTREKIWLIQESIQVAQSWQNSYADRRTWDLKFEVGDHVYHMVSPQHLVTQGGMKGKLMPRYIGPYSIIEWVRRLAYRLKHPASLSNIWPMKFGWKRLNWEIINLYGVTQTNLGSLRPSFKE